MDQGLATLAVGILGIGGTFAGTFGGIYVGRKQVTDQSVVEHGHWLRNQRQEAYVQFTDAWDTAVQQLIKTGTDREDLDHSVEQSGGELSPADIVQARALHFEKAFTRQLDRIGLLGPDDVDEVALQMKAWFGEMAAYLVAQVRPRAGEWTDFKGHEDRGAAVRARFLRVAKCALRTPPRPGD